MCSVYAPQPVALPEWHLAFPPGFNPVLQAPCNIAIPPPPSAVLPTYGQAISAQPSAPPLGPSYGGECLVCMWLAALINPLQACRTQTPTRRTPRLLQLVCVKMIFFPFANRDLLWQRCIRRRPVVGDAAAYAA